MNTRPASIIFGIILASVATLAIGCASSPTTLPKSGATSSSSTNGPLALAFDKTAVNLGTVYRNQEGVQTFLVMNWSANPLQVGPTNVLVEQGCSESVEVLGPGVSTVPPKEAAILPVKLGQHRQLGPHHVVLTTPSTDPSLPSATLRMSFNVVEEPAAEGTGPRLRVDKEAIDIGKVPFDWPLYEQFTLRNDGDALLTLDIPPSPRVEQGC